MLRGMQVRFPLIDPALNWLLVTSFNQQVYRSVQAFVEREGMGSTQFGRCGVTSGDVRRRDGKPG